MHNIDGVTQHRIKRQNKNEKEEKEKNLTQHNVLDICNFITYDAKQDTILLCSHNTVNG